MGLIARPRWVLACALAAGCTTVPDALEPLEPVLVPSVQGELVGAALDGEGDLWLLDDLGDGTGQLIGLDGDLSEVAGRLDLDLTPRDLAWFVGGWLVVGERQGEAAFQRLQPDGTVIDFGEPFNGTFVAVATDGERAVLGGTDAGVGVALVVDGGGVFSETWRDLDGVRVSDVGLLDGDIYVATVRAVGGTEVLRRGEQDERVLASLVTDTLCPTPGGEVFLGGSTVPPPAIRPATAWVQADLSIEREQADTSGGEGRVLDCVAWDQGVVLAVQQGGAGRAEDELVVAVERGSEPGVDAVPSGWAQPLVGEDVEIRGLVRVGERLVAVGTSGGRAAWWVMTPP